MPSLEKQNRIRCGKLDLAYTIQADPGSMLALMAITKMLPDRIQHVYWDIKLTNYEVLARKDLVNTLKIFQHCYYVNQKSAPDGTHAPSPTKSMSHTSHCRTMEDPKKDHCIILS